MISSKRFKINSILARNPANDSGNQLVFEGGIAHASNTAGTKSMFGFLQDFFKKRPRIYRLIVDSISPVASTNHFRRTQGRLLRSYDINHVIVNYGSGPFTLPGRQDVINVDLFAFDAVDIVCDLSLPFANETVDFFISIAVLEHLRKPSVAVAEMYRCLKPGGQLLVSVPFMQPLHAAPHDYQRYTQAGLKELLSAFEIVEMGISAGSTSCLLWVAQHWLAGLLCLGNKHLKDVILIVLMLISFPVKFLDYLIEPIDDADISSAYFVHCRKT
jgi:SAM-dependent methyltransferase